MKYTSCDDCKHFYQTEMFCKNTLGCKHAFTINSEKRSNAKECFEPELDCESDVVNHPGHYTCGKYECIDEMINIFGEDAVIDFCKCNVYKYRYRFAQKNGEEDLQKAEWYMGKLIELQEKQPNKIGF